ncbi:hypothetical protein BJ138DRAFT_994581, partial [Hygrophoropsis aurantiaca]
SPRYLHISRIDPSTPSNKFAKLVNSLPRRHASLLFQLRSNHAPLNKHLFRIKGTADEPETPLCPACKEKEETVHHYILACPSHRPARDAMNRALPWGKKNLPSLLSDPKCTRPLMKYIAATKRFEQTFGNV